MDVEVHRTIIIIIRLFFHMTLNRANTGYIYIYIYNTLNHAIDLIIWLASNTNNACFSKITWDDSYGNAENKSRKLFRALSLMIVKFGLS